MELTKFQLISIADQACLIFPILFGAYRYNELDSPVRYFYWSLIFGAIDQLFFELNALKSTPQVINVQNYIYDTVNITCIFASAFFWLSLNNVKIKTIIVFLSLLVLGLIETCIIGLNTYRFSYVMRGAYFIMCIFCIRAVLDNFLNQPKVGINFSCTLILVPIIAYTLFDLSTSIFVIIHVKKIFNNYLYIDKFLNCINIVSYLSFSLAFLWAKPKEQFL